MIESGRRHRRKQGMEYNEQAFKEKANLKAMKVWLALIAIMTLSYGSDLSKGIYTATQYVVFLVMAWVPFAIGLLTLKLKGRATPCYKDVLALGYGFFYAYVVCITDSATAYAYILPLTSMLILFKDRSYMIRCAVTNEIVIVISAILHVFLGLNPNVKMTDYYLQFSTLLLCYICYILSVDHLNESDGALVASIRDNLSRVVTTVGQVKGASSSIVDGVTVVRELADENRQGADSVVSSMEELTRNNDVLHNKTLSSMDRSTDISTQVQNVAGLIDEMVTLIQESVEHADVSAEELADVMNTTDTMAALSGEVEQVLDVAHDGVHVRAAEKRRVEVEPDHAAAVADGAKEVIREIARVRAHAAAVRVRGDHRTEPKTHHIPRCRL